MLRLLLTAALVFAPSLRAQDSTQARVLAAEDRRFAAMVRGDTAALRTMLADDLAYTHTTGEKQIARRSCAPLATLSYGTRASRHPSGQCVLSARMRWW